jgi:molybdenum cofactor synthesis domain-containing protein
MSESPAGATAWVITVSDRAFAGAYEDRSGPLAAELLAAAGLRVGEVAVVPDAVPQIVAALHAAIEADVDLVVTTGGTGLAPRDVTPEATLRVVEREVPGIVEAMRAQARDEVPTAMLSRAVAGVVRHTIVVNLPGSTGGVRDGVAVLQRVLGHALAQVRGGDHPHHGRGHGGGS